MQYLDLEHEEILEKLSKFIKQPFYNKLYETMIQYLYKESDKNELKETYNHINIIPPHKLVKYDEDSQMDYNIINKIIKSPINNKRWEWYIIPNHCLITCSLILYSFLVSQFPNIKWYLLRQPSHVIISNRLEVSEKPSSYTHNISNPVIINIEDHFYRKIYDDWDIGYFIPGRKDITTVYDNWSDVKLMLNNFIDTKLIDDVCI